MKLSIYIHKNQLIACKHTNDLLCATLTLRLLFFIFVEQRQLHKAGVAFLTHPLLLLAVTMVTNPQYQGHNRCVVLYCYFACVCTARHRKTVVFWCPVFSLSLVAQQLRPQDCADFGMIIIPR